MLQCPNHPQDLWVDPPLEFCPVCYTELLEVPDPLERAAAGSS